MFRPIDIQFGEKGPTPADFVRMKRQHVFVLSGRSYVQRLTLYITDEVRGETRLIIDLETIEGPRGDVPDRRE